MQLDNSLHEIISSKLFTLIATLMAISQKKNEIALKVR